jgi:N-acetylneuraminic acid mutarotase
MPRMHTRGGHSRGTTQSLLAATLLVLAVAACRDTPVAPPSSLTLPGGGLPGSPGTVTDLTVAEVTLNSVTLSFTEVNDGLGQPARYVVRYAEPPIAWGSATTVTEGTCATPVFGQGVGARLTCTVLGLAPSATYEFQVAAYRSTLGLVEIFGNPSNVAQGTTSAPAPGTVTDLSVTAVTGSSATLAFTEVDNGEGQPAQYFVRYAEPPIEWDAAPDVTEGTCTPPVVGVQVGAQLTCTVLGLAPSTTYEFQVLAYRGTFGEDAVFGDLSNVAQGTTGAASCDCWTPKAFMPTPRYSPGVADVNGTLYAVGGYQAYGRYPAAVEAYDPASDTWTTRASLPTLRQGLGAAVVGGILYAVGGYRSASGGPLGTVEAYDPATDTWTPKVPMPTARTNLGVAAVDGIIYAVGGQGIVSGDGLTTLEAYDPATDTWTTKAPMPTARHHLGVAVINGVLFAVGGSNSLGAADILEAYDPVTDTWTARAPMPSALGPVGAAAIDGILYVEHTGPSGLRLKTLLAYDTATDTWTTKAPMPMYDTSEGMTSFGVVAVAGMLYAVGGNDGRGYLKQYQP